MSQLVERLRAKALKASEQIAIIEDDTQWTYGELFEKINRLASALAGKGIQPGDRVALMFLNQKEFLLGFLALRRLGAVPVPINIQMPPDDIVYVILNSGTRLVLTTESFAPKFEGKPIPILVSNQREKKYPSLEEAVEQGDPNFSPSAEHKANEMHVLMYTSGTTGKPKGVMLSEENLLANMDGVAKILDFEAEPQRMLLALPLFHAYGLMIGLVALDGLAPIVLVPNFAPKKIVEMIATHQVTILPLVPTMFTVLLRAAEKAGKQAFGSLRLCVSGGASLPKQLLKQVEDALDLVVIEGYGLTETSPVLAVNNPKTGSIPGSVGKPLYNVNIKLVDDNGQTVPDKAEGEILAKGDNVMLGYYGLDEETKAVFDSDGFFKTGDIGRFDDAGNLYISGGRKKDLIIKAGENISPLRIEEVLYQHPAVREASVIGIPDEKLGEDILACIELEEDKRGIAEKDMAKSLKDFCLEQLTPFMCPAEFRFFDELPKNPTGKIVKKALKEQVLATASAHS